MLRRSEMACLSDVLDHVEPGQEEELPYLHCFESGTMRCEVSTRTLLRRVRQLLDLYDAGTHVAVAFPLSVCSTLRTRQSEESAFTDSSPKPEAP